MANRTGRAAWVRMASGHPGRLLIMRSGEVDKPNSRTEISTELRARAARTRRYARTLVLDEAGPKLLALADELDARADAMESTSH